MPSLLLVVFLLQLVIYIINTFGAETIDQLLWVLYSKLPTPTSKAAREQIRLKGEVVRIKRQLAAVSAQDDFARWAKLRRQQDKAMAEFEKSDNALKSSQTTFMRIASTLRWVSTNGLRLFVQIWFRRIPMFWIPEGWVPGYVEWILSFPKAPRGSVSINVWGIACRSVITLSGRAIKATYILATGKPVEAEKPQAFKADVKQGETKKEL
jgi:hypothetical protein